MTWTVDQLENAALELPDDERAHLIERLLASFEGHTAFEQEWSEEIHRRLDEYEAGGAESVPGDEVFAEARRRLSR
ncbi:MAG TPA: addiction module protein [Longimicrobiaceae bacterium]|jgi:putative addiction module component (TIGR02574 family)